MKKELHCKDCGKYMGTVKKGSMRKGMVTLCFSCHEAPKYTYDVPDFLRGLFK